MTSSEVQVAIGDARTTGGAKSLPEMTTVELQEALQRTDMVVIACGSIEVHGPHLPLATDYLQGVRVSREIVKSLAERGHEAVSGPTLPFGLQTNRYERSAMTVGNVCIRSDTFRALLKDVVNSLRRDGFRRFVLVMSHVENEASMHVAAKELAEETDAQLVVLNWIQAINDDYPKILSGNARQGHAGEGETARMLAIAPDLVNLEGLESYYPTVDREPVKYSDLQYFGGAVGVYHPTREDSGPGYIGEPHLATAEAGEDLLRSMADWMADVAVQYLC
jgi:creatinine amidohydrolase